MKSHYLILIAVIGMISCNRNVGSNHQSENTDSCSPFECGMPVDLSDVLQAYDLYQKSNTDERDSIEQSFLDKEMCVEDITLFEDNSFVLRIPEYKDSKNSFLALAEDFYNNCSFAWNLWSNFEVWYRGHTAGELRSDKDIIRSIKAFDANIMKDAELAKAAQNYKDSILLLLSMGLDEWDDAHNPWGVRNTYCDMISEKSFRLYTDKDVFQLSYDSVVIAAESMGKNKFQHYLNSNEDEQLYVILTELNTCKNFDEQCSLLRNWANCEKSSGEEPWLIAVGKKLMESGNYNLNLNRIWITWRTICQSYCCGASRDSVIPNPFYNKYRKMCYCTCLRWIEKHPDDIFAMNCAESLAGNPNINRFGRFSMGNDSAIDAMEMMPERYGYDKDGEEEIDD